MFNYLISGLRMSTQTFTKKVINNNRYLRSRLGKLESVTFYIRDSFLFLYSNIFPSQDNAHAGALLHSTLSSQGTI